MRKIAVKESNQQVIKMINKQMDFVMKSQDLIGKYTEKGIKIKFNFSIPSFDISFMNREYRLTIVQKNDGFYWHLEPYANTFFEAKLNESKVDLDYPLKAVEDDYEIHRKNLKKL